MNSEIIKKIIAEWLGDKVFPPLIKAERKTGLTWDRIRGVMERLHLIEFFSKDGRVLQTTEPTPEQHNIFKLLKISPPKRMQNIQMNP